ncbi:MAG: adenosylcobinamide-phosphate synthase CbiB [Paracoccaceae bacterium]
MLFAALLLDAAFGEPPWLWRRIPHPAVLMGDLIEWLEAELNKGAMRGVKGGVALGILIVAVLAPALFLSLDIFGGIPDALIAAVLLAQRSLVEHITAVAEGLEESLTAGREAVARVVGRDPETLDEAGVARAAIESAAENLSDGVVAPAFWFVIAGLPGIAVYKAVNTADSMIGHKTPRLKAFGYAAAKLDDLMNWIPARITGYLLCIVPGDDPTHRIETMRSDAPLHASPNAGWPEAAMAASLGIAIAGPRSYGGQIVDDPYMNADGRREATAADIRRAVGLLWRVWGILVAIAAVFALGLLIF